MNLFSKTSRRIYSKPVKPVVKRSNLCLKTRLIEGVTELWKIGLCQKRKFQQQYPCIYLKPITYNEKLNLTCP